MSADVADNDAVVDQHVLLFSHQKMLAIVVQHLSLQLNVLQREKCGNYSSRHLKATEVCHAAPEEGTSHRTSGLTKMTVTYSYKRQLLEIAAALSTVTSPAHLPSPGDLALNIRKRKNSRRNDSRRTNNEDR